MQEPEAEGSLTSDKTGLQSGVMSGDVLHIHIPRKQPLVEIITVSSF